MSYTPIDWVQHKTPINEANLDRMENGIVEAHKTADANTERIKQIAGNQIPEEYLQASVDNYIENNQAGLATKTDIDNFKSAITKGTENLYDAINNPIKRGFWVGHTADVIIANSFGWYCVIPIEGGFSYTVSRKNAGVLHIASCSELPYDGIKTVDRFRTSDSAKYMIYNTSESAKYLFVGVNAGSTLNESLIEELKIEKGVGFTRYNSGLSALDINLRNDLEVYLAKESTRNKWNPLLYPIVTGIFANGNTFSENGGGHGFIMPIVGGKIYTISKKNKGYLGVLTFAEYPKIGDTSLSSWFWNGETNKLVVNTVESAKYMFVAVQAGGAISEVSYEELMVCEGTENNGYIPAYSNIDYVAREQIGNMGGIMNYVYVSKTGSDLTGDGTKENPFATIYKANESITDNSKSNPYTIIVGQGTYTDLQEKYAGTYSGSYEGITCKDYVYYESENVLRPDLCVLSWNGIAGFDEANATLDMIVDKCLFHICRDTHTHIKGFTIESINTRYALHIECWGATSPTEYLVENCIFNWGGRTCLELNEYNEAPIIGVGTSGNLQGHFKNCVMNCTSNNAYNKMLYQSHDNKNSLMDNGIINGEHVVFENCRFGVVWNIDYILINPRNYEIAHYDILPSIHFINCVGKPIKINYRGNDEGQTYNIITEGTSVYNQ